MAQETMRAGNFSRLQYFAQLHLPIYEMDSIRITLVTWRNSILKYQQTKLQEDEEETNKT